MKRLATSLTFFLVLALVIGFLLSGPSFMDWGVVERAVRGRGRR